MKNKILISLVLTLLIFSSALVPYKADAITNNQLNTWFTYGGNSGNSFFAPVTHNPQFSTEYNTIAAGNRPWSIVNSNTIYTTNLNAPHKLYSINLTNNTIQWEFVSDNSKEIHQIVASGSMVYLLTSEKIYALQNHGNTHEIKWTIDPLEHEKFSTLTLDNGNVYYGSVDEFTKQPLKNNKIIAVDASTGKRKWSHSLGQHDPMPIKLVTGEGKVFFFINNQITMETNLYALDQNTSFVQWIAPIHPHLSPSSGFPVYQNGRLFLDVSTNTNNVTVRAFNASTGRNLWQYKLLNNFGVSHRNGVLNATNDAVNFIDNRGNLISLNASTGGENWNVRYADSNSNGQLIHSRMPFISTNNHIILENNRKIKLYNIKSGEKVNEDLFANRFLVPMMVVGDRFIASDNTGISSFLFSKLPTEEKQPVTFETYTVESGDTLGRIAERFSTTAGYLTEINQLANPNMLFVGQQLKVPTKQTPPSTPVVPPIGATIGTYTVEKGDTLGKIAEKHATTTAYLTEINQLTNANMIFVGQVLKVPTPSLPAPPAPITIEYIIKAGDTLGKIATNHQVTVDEIVSANNITNPNTIFVGQKIFIPSKQSPTTITHVVMAGESLWSISQKYGISMDTIIKNNSITNPSQLTVGQRLIIQ